MSETDNAEVIEGLRQRIVLLERDREPDLALGSDPSGQSPSLCSCFSKPLRGLIIDERGQLIRERVGAVRTQTRSTIDGSRNDSGFLGCIFAAYSSGGFNPSTHWSTAQAFANLRAIPKDWSIIVGHGMPGCIVTGTGQTLDGVDKYISLRNQASWMQWASQGVPGLLTLFGCQVAGDGGALISRVANVIRKQVGAWTGDVYCNPSTGEVWGTGNFVVASPGRALAPIEPYVMYETSKDMNIIRLQSSEGYENIKVGAVKSVNFTPIGSAPQHSKTLNLRAKGVSSLLRTIDFENPFVTEDKPGAILVGQLSITFEGESKDEQTRSFRVLAYSLIQDVCFPTTYYHASADLRHQLMGSE